jgi:hypothetical protein
MTTRSVETTMSHIKSCCDDSQMVRAVVVAATIMVRESGESLPDIVKELSRQVVPHFWFHAAKTIENGMGRAKQFDNLYYADYMEKVQQANRQQPQTYLRLVVARALQHLQVLPYDVIKWTKSDLINALIKQEPGRKVNSRQTIPTLLKSLVKHLPHCHQTAIKEALASFQAAQQGQIPGASMDALLLGPTASEVQQN